MTVTGSDGGAEEHPSYACWLVARAVDWPLSSFRSGMLVELANTLMMLAAIEHTRETLDIVEGLAERVCAIVSAAQSAEV